MARPRRNTAAHTAKAETKETAVQVQAETKAEAKAEPQAEEQKPVRRAERTVIVEFAGKQIKAKEILAKAEAAYEEAHKGVEIKTLELYISPEQNAAYYVVNGEGSDEFKIEL